MVKKEESDDDRTRTNYRLEKKKIKEELKMIKKLPTGNTRDHKIIKGTLNIDPTQN